MASVRPFEPGDDLWRGSLLPLGREAAPKFGPHLNAWADDFGAAAQPSGSKLPRHGALWFPWDGRFTGYLPA
ncbi:hypothetical protein FHK92_11820 [Pseudomonas brassicacearum subsp. neoaurantiaca]|uniref:Uncharacterized protein n=1 Tax=Pseudomonas brassicacearum subsp. neoaurantiaca TaxID=494916 RepID=A0A7V8RMK7_9PSED|nr:hypothetical protein [Pseudomonas brassicacearum subsp. neoaurantiaca]